MSVELYPDHKAILNYYQPLTVLEIDLLSYLTTLLSREPFVHRQFHIFVKPTLHQTAFDFVILEPKHALYIIQTPASEEEFLEKQEALKENLNPSRQNEAHIKTLHYIYNEQLYNNLIKKEDKNLFISPEDFELHPERIQDFFNEEAGETGRLTAKESRHIARLLKPNTNIDDYISKTIPTKYEAYAKSVTQSKQKFKGAEGVGKTTLLVHRILSAARRLNGAGKVLVVAGNPENVLALKDLITAEDGRSLQELGINVESYQQLNPPAEKYKALFVDDAEYLKRSWLNDLLENFLIEMTPENDYEYVVMAGEENLPKVPQIFGRFITLEKDARYLDELLQDSRDIFLEILHA